MIWSPDQQKRKGSLLTSNLTIGMSVEEATILSSTEISVKVPLIKQPLPGLAGRLSLAKVVPLKLTTPYWMRFLRVYGGVGV